MQENYSKFVFILTMLSIAAVLLGYDFLDLSMEFEVIFLVVFIGVVSGFIAMRLCNSLLAKCLVGVPTALNSIVLLYFCSPAVFYLIESVENA